MEREEFVGRMMEVLRLPQYLVEEKWVGCCCEWVSAGMMEWRRLVRVTHLMHAMLTGAEAVA